MRNGFIEDKENDRHALESQLKAIQQALLSNKIPVPEPVQSDSQNNTTEVEEDVEIEYTLKKKKGQDWRESLDDVMKRLAKEEQDKKMVKTCSISWERIQELLKSHTNAPIAEEPYVRCLFDHAPNLISYQRTLLEALVEEEMKKRGMTKEHIVDHWNKDPFIAEFVAGKMMELDSTQLQKTNTDRAYGSLRTHLEREMEEMVEKNFVMQPKQITVQSLVDFARGKKSSRSRPVSVNKPDDGEFLIFTFQNVLINFTNIMINNTQQSFSTSPLSRAKSNRPHQHPNPPSPHPPNPPSSTEPTAPTPAPAASLSANQSTSPAKTVLPPYHAKDSLIPK